MHNLNYIIIKYFVFSIIVCTLSIYAIPNIVQAKNIALDTKALCKVVFADGEERVITKNVALCGWVAVNSARQEKRLVKFIMFVLNDYHNAEDMTIFINGNHIKDVSAKQEFDKEYNQAFTTIYIPIIDINIIDTDNSGMSIVYIDDKLKNDIQYMELQIGDKYVKEYIGLLNKKLIELQR